MGGDRCRGLVGRRRNRGRGVAIGDGQAARRVELHDFWLAVGIVALVIGCSEIAWHYATRATPGERRRSREVVGQFLPALVAGALVTPWRSFGLSPSLVTLLPGLWALLLRRRGVRGAPVRAARERMGCALLLRRRVVPALARGRRHCPLTVGGRRDIRDWTVVCRGGALLEHRTEIAMRMRALDDAPIEGRDHGEKA